MTTTTDIITAEHLARLRARRKRIDAAGDVVLPRRSTPFGPSHVYTPPTAADILREQRGERIHELAKEWRDSLAMLEEYEVVYAESPAIEGCRPAGCGPPLRHLPESTNAIQAVAYALLLGQTESLGSDIRDLEKQR